MALDPIEIGMATLYEGHALKVLQQLPSDSVHCCVTSPPYWGLRAYGTNPQIWGDDPACMHQWVDGPRMGKGGTPLIGSGLEGGLGSSAAAMRSRIAGKFCGLCGAWAGELGSEPTPDLYVEHIVEVFREVRRVLHPSGTLWINLGDSYANNAAADRASVKAQEKQFSQRPPSGLKAKDMVGIPWLVAFALRADGWWLRSDIVWEKPNCMPSSVTDRPTKAHEFMFLLSKSADYAYDKVAVLEPFADPRQGRDGSKRKSERNRGGRTDGYTKPNGIDPSANGGRNLRSVWRIPTRPYKGAHFAVFPPELVDPCIKAGASEGGCCPGCSAPYERVVEKQVEFAGCSGRLGNPIEGKWEDSPHQTTGDYDLRAGPQVHVKTVGWSPVCGCEGLAMMDLDAVPCVVLDPFVGSGTTCAVAQSLRRRSIGIDLNPEYLSLAITRIEASVS